LTGPRTAGQSRIVMAAFRRDDVAQRDDLRDERDAQVERQAGCNGRDRLGRWIRCECAFTYMNAVFRKNLTQLMAVEANDVDTAAPLKR
jgi:hypothetical protein